MNTAVFTLDYLKTDFQEACHFVTEIGVPYDNYALRNMGIVLYSEIFG
jgi:hypothetical protein